MLAVLPLLLTSQLADLPPCDKTRADQGIQSDLNMCAHREYVIADRKLNAQWRKTATKMRANDTHDNAHSNDVRPGYFDTLLEAQRAWLAYRDAHCRAEGYWARGGSMEPMLVSFCLTELTENRTQELQSLAEWPE